MPRVLWAVVVAGCAASPPRPAPVDGDPATDAPAAPSSTEARSPALSAGLLEGAAALDEAQLRWDAGTATSYDALFEIAVLANRARPRAGADVLMVDALERALAASGCDAERLGRIRLLAIAVRGTPDHPAALDRRLDRLADVGPTECRHATR